MDIHQSVIGLLAAWRRGDLVRLLRRSKLVLEPTGTFGSHWHSVLTCAVFFSSVKDCELLRNLPKEDTETVLRAIREIHPPADDDYEITWIEHRIDPEAIPVLDLGQVSATDDLTDIIRNRDLGSLEVEFQRALDAIAVDPPTAVTAACSLFESFCKVYIEDENLEMPKKSTAKPLWRTVQKHIALSPEQQTDDDLKRILSGLTSIIDGFSSLRTHKGSAHGRGKNSYRVADRHARLTVNASHSIVLFLLETWSDRRGNST
jgi:hypothetical protein